MLIAKINKYYIGHTKSRDLEKKILCVKHGTKENQLDHYKI